MKTLMTLGKVLLDDVKDGMLNWYVSIKYDGVRCYWNGKNLYTRGKKKISAPIWFVEKLPANVPLDGELYIPNQFEKINGLIKIKSKSKLVKRMSDWKEVKYMVFDTLHPGFLDKSYKKRYKLIKALYKKSRQTTQQHVWKVVKQVPLKQSRQKLIDFYTARVREGCEGVVIRNPNASYEHKRSNEIVKIKPIYDAEAKVIGYVEGNGVNENRLGSFLVVGVSADHKGSEFKLSGRLNNDMRKAYKFLPSGNVVVKRGYPRIGSIVNYEYMTTTKNGKPRQPIFIRML